MAFEEWATLGGFIGLVAAWAVGLLTDADDTVFRNESEKGQDDGR